MKTNLSFFILADGHYNSLGLVRSIGKAGYNPKIFLVNCKNAIVMFSKFAKDLTFCENVDEAINNIIENYSDFEGLKFILTGNDKFITAIDSRNDKLRNNFITFNRENKVRLTHLMSKAVQNHLASKVGLNVPKFSVVNVKDKTIPDVPFPVITKAVNSLGTHWKDIVYLCHNEDELRKAYEKIDAEEIIVQHYIEKINETGFNGISINGGNEVYLPLQLTYMSTSETSFGNAIKLFLPSDPSLVKKIKLLIKNTGYSGPFSVDLIIGKDSVIYFLEINFRNSGWSYPYTCAGANLPVMWAESTANGFLDTSREKIIKLPFYAVDEFTELYENSKKGLLKALGTLPQFFKSDVLIYWDKDDMKPFYHLVFSKIKSHLHF